MVSINLERKLSNNNAEGLSKMFLNADLGYVTLGSSVIQLHGAVEVRRLELQVRKIFNYIRGISHNNSCKVEYLINTEGINQPDLYMAALRMVLDDTDLRLCQKSISKITSELGIYPVYRLEISLT